MKKKLTKINKFLSSFGQKKKRTILFLGIYILSYFLHSFLFIDLNVSAEEPIANTNLVAVLVDDRIYDSIEDEVEWYAKNYIQSQIDNSKAIVLSINVDSENDNDALKAKDIVRLLENMYFDGIEDETSTLQGLVLIGDIPLPVVENRGFVYPTIYPYVDFEDQQFIYNDDSGYFVYNKNLAAQAEVWHGIISYDSVLAYQHFFEKLETYIDDPQGFIAKRFWYDDFIAVKKYFSTETLQAYMNNFIFADDVANRRFTNSMLDLVKGNYNEMVNGVINSLQDGLDDIDLGEEDDDFAQSLSDYAAEMQALTAEAGLGEEEIKTPTLSLRSVIREFFKGYDSLIGTNYLSIMRDNTDTAARWYSLDQDDNVLSAVDSHYNKIEQKDSWVKTDFDTKFIPLLVEFNDLLEESVDTQIEDEKYYMKIPVPTEYKYNNYKNTVKTVGSLPIPIRWCEPLSENVYQNYYFGKSADSILTAQKFSIYRGTFKNLAYDDFTGLTANDIQNSENPISDFGNNIENQSIGGSYGLFATQIEANRGYNTDSMMAEFEIYDLEKINQNVFNNGCIEWYLPFEWDFLCKTYGYVPDEDSDLESPEDFAVRNWGGASTINLNQDLLGQNIYELKSYYYEWSWKDIYDMGGSQKINTPEYEANSYLGLEKYGSMIQTKNANGLMTYPKYIDGNLQAEGKNVLGYSNVDFFSVYNKTSDQGVGANRLSKEIYVEGGLNGIKNSKWNSILTLISKCIGKFIKQRIYSYNLVDSRVKNDAFNMGQLEGEPHGDYEEGGVIYETYEEIMSSIDSVKSTLLTEKSNLQGDDGPSKDMIDIKDKIDVINSDINTFLNYSFSANTSTDIINSQVTFVNDIITDTKIDLLHTKANDANLGLNNLYTTINGLSLGSTNILLQRLDYDVKFLPAWIANLNTELSLLDGYYNDVRGEYNTSVQKYNDIVTISTYNAALTNKWSYLDGLITSGTMKLGCDYGYKFRSLCNTIVTLRDNEIPSLRLEINDTSNDEDDVKSEIIEFYETDGDSDWTLVNIFTALNDLFPRKKTSFTAEKITVNTKINNIDTVSNPADVKNTAPMTFTTKDRPIDSPKYITFQGIGGSLVKFIYPNLYQVEVFNEEDGQLYLKTRDEIKVAIEVYLRQVIDQYNEQLNEQRLQKSSFYNDKGSAAFNFLETADESATPNRNYGSFDQDYFIDILGDNIDMLAELLYYHNITWPVKAKGNTLMDDLNKTRVGFDINQKISYIVQNYLIEDNNQGSIITPTYSENGYEVAYINSDGADFIAAGEIPEFVKNIKDYQSAFSIKQQAMLDAAKDSLNNNLAMGDDIDAECNVDESGSVPLLERPETFMCWLDKTLEKPLTGFFKLSFKDAMGPVIGSDGTFLSTFYNNYQETGTGDLTLVFAEHKEEMESYKEMVQALNVDSNNDVVIASLPVEPSSNLQEILSYSVAEVDIGDSRVDSFSGSITIKSSRDLGDVEISISAIGNNCLAIANISENLCDDPYVFEENYNYNWINIPLSTNEMVAGSTVIVFELCLPGYDDACVKKTQKIDLIPSILSNINISSPTDMVMIGGTLPIFVKGYDAYDNRIHQMIDDYKISTDVGSFLDNKGSKSSLFTFNNFDKVKLKFIAPLDPGFAHIDIAGVRSSTEMLTGSKIISVVEGVLDVKYNNENISVDGITYSLPDELTAISYIDVNNVQQVNTDNLLKLTLNLNTVGGLPLSAGVDIQLSSNLLDAGYIENRQVILNGGGDTIQRNFRTKKIFYIRDGILDVYFYPSFSAGEEKITIKIPGLDAVEIPVIIEPGSPKLVNLTIDSNIANIDTELGGRIELRDIWENLVTKNTNVIFESVGPAKIDGQTRKEIVIQGGVYDDFNIQAMEPGGQAFVYAFVDTGVLLLTEQQPGYQELLVQKAMLPEEKLNVMYLNLFGTDWGNQRGYFSDYDKKVNNIMEKSSKLLAVTTQLTNPFSLKKIAIIVNKNGQIKNIGSEDILFNIQNDEFNFVVEDIVTVKFDQDFDIYSPEGTLEEFKNTFEDTKNNIFVDKQSSILYFPENTDSVITGNIVVDNAIIINEEVVLDFDDKYKSPLLEITLTNKKYDKYLLWNLNYDGESIGKIIIWTNNETFIDGKESYDDVFEIENMDYDLQFSFAESSTNGSLGIAIFEKKSSFPKTVSYDSIEASGDPGKNIGFRSDFKNITLFGDGEFVGKATLPFGSHFLVNFGDPLLKRINDNMLLDGTNFDGGVGREVFSTTDKSIFKVFPIDFNNDNLQDLLVVYTDGTVKISKNYGGEDDPYKSLQNLMIIVGGIKDIQVGDVDGNDYADILVWTTNNQLRAYTNDKGVFDVDGKLVCLNTSVVPGDITENPEDISDINQVFFAYMDEKNDTLDGTLDIVTNDSKGDIKIFYGGSTEGRAHYLSTLAYSCDADWYQEQPENTKLVKRFGIELSNSVVQDFSLIHWYGLVKPEISNPELPDGLGDLANNEDPSFDFDEDDFDMDELMDAVSGLLGDRMDAATDLPINDIIADASKDLFRYVQNPFDFPPVYETFLEQHEIHYIPMAYLSGDDKLEIVKEYNDLNGDILQAGDEVEVTVYIKALEDTQATFIDQILGPWDIEKNSDGELSGFQTILNEGNPNLLFRWTLTNSDGYMYMVDNMALEEGDHVEFSYILKYNQPQLTRISIEDKIVTESNCVGECFEDNILVGKDFYNDIIVKPNNSCMKSMWVFANRNDGDHRSYDEYFVDLAKKMADYQKSLQLQMDESMQEFQDGLMSSMTEGMGGGSFDIPGDVFETSWDSLGIMDGMSLGDFMAGGEINLGNINLDVFGGKISDIEGKIQGVLDGMCQGFKLGGGDPCPGLPIPFNMDLLGPGQFNIMGCPLSPAFAGLPVFHFPGTAYVPSPIPIPWGLKSPMDDFLRIPGGSPTYISQIRIYVSPTLTMQLGVAICLGPTKGFSNLPPLIGDVAGNCIVMAIPFPCGNEDDGGYGPDQEIPAEFLDAADMGTCSKPQHPASGRSEPSGGYSNYNPSDNSGNYSLAGVEILSSPFQLVSAGDDSSYPTPAIPAGSFVGGMIEFDTVPVVLEDVEDGARNLIDLKAGPKINNKIIGGKAGGLAKCIVQDWMDRQIKYTMNNLTKMTIGITFPDLSDMLVGFDTLSTVDGESMENVGGGSTYCEQDPDYFECVLQKITDEDEKAGYIKEIERNTEAGPNADNLEVAKILAQNNMIQMQQLDNASQSMSNPFDALSSMFKDVRLINLNSKDIHVKIPMIYGEDIGKYTDYLRTWLEINQRIISKWEDLFISTVGYCAKEEKTAGEPMPSLEQSRKDLVSNFKKAIKNIRNQKDLIIIKTGLEKKLVQQLAKSVGAETDEIKNTKKQIKQIEKQLKKTKTCMKFLDKKSLGNFMDFQSSTQQLIDSIRKNIRVLEKYKTFPFELYEWIHVQDRYLAEVSAISTNFVGTIMTWMEANAKRFASYVDAMVALLNSIKTRQILIDLSANWSSKCGKCSVDTYDQYSCKLSFICPSLSIIPIPPFKIPNIFIDLSHIKLGMDILLPKMNFVPMRIDLPKLPNIPSPPSYNFDIGTDEQLSFGIDILANLKLDFGGIVVPGIPILPEPPDLPELPSFLPSVEMELPVLPPAPKIPALSPKIEALIKLADWVGKIFCILKGGIGLVAENAVKSKIEQLTQRSYHVPIFDDFNLTLEMKEPPLKGFDYKIDSYVAMEYNFDNVFQYIEGITTAVNSVTTSVGQVTQNYINKSGKLGGEFVDGLVDSGAVLFDEGMEGLGDIMDDLSSTVKDRTGMDKAKSILDYEEKLKDWTQESVKSLEDLPQNEIEDMKNRTKDEFDQYKEKQLEAYFPQHKFTYVNYKIASKGLLNSLSFLQNYMGDDKIMSERVNVLFASMNEDHEVSPNIDGMLDLQKQVDLLVDEKRDELNNLSTIISGDYRKFLEMVENNYVSLVSDKQEQIAFDLPLVNIKDSTKILLASQEHPTKTYLKMSANEADGYLNALNNNSAATLRMTPSEHQKTTNYLKNVKNKIDEALPLLANNNQIRSNEIPLIAEGDTCMFCDDANEGTASDQGVSIDLSSYIKGIFIPSEGGSMVNVVNSEKIVSKIKDNYFVDDINSDGMDDVVMWSKKTVYVKYALDSHNYEGPISDYDNHYYFWHISGVSDLEALLEDDGYQRDKFPMNIKLWDENWEVKSFAMRGQSFDTISFSWKNSVFAGDNPDGYIIEFNHRIDTFYDEEQEYFNNDDLWKNKNYILLLPKGAEGYTGWYLDLEEGLGLIDDLMTGTVSQVKSYDKYKSNINLTLTEMPRAWQYARITTLKQEETRHGQTLFINAPWSNQLVAGRQILADTIGPEPIITLERIATEEILSTGSIHEGYVATHYNLNAFWEDNVVVKDMRIDYEGKTILSGESYAKTGFISLDNLFFTGDTTLKFTFWAQDVNENIEQEEVKLDISIPDISIVDISASYNTRLVTAELSHDVDSGAVTFEKNRSEFWQYLSGTRDSDYGGYFVGVGDTIITGGIYDFGYDIGIYDIDGIQIGELSPINGEIIIYPEYISVIDLRMNFDTNLPRIEIFDSRVQNILFLITLPMKDLVGIDIHQGTYSLVNLNAEGFDQFVGGKAIVSQDNEILLYISPVGKISVPSPSNTSLKGEYSFDQDLGNVQYNIYIIQNTLKVDIATLNLKVDPFITSK